MLKVFTGFQLDVAADFTGLSHSEIRWLRENKMVSPKKTKEGYIYTFGDILTLRLVRILKAHGVKPRNISRAHQYLKSYDPETSLSSLKLYLREDTKAILSIGDSPTATSMVSLSDYGQLLATGVLVVIPVGHQLEAMRKDVLTLDRRLGASLKAKRFSSLETVEKRYGISG